MSNFKIIPLSAEYADRISKTMTDHFGNPVVKQIATGLGPCRVSLQPFEKGVDTRLLFKHSPFTINNAYNQPGPIFIKQGAREYTDVYRFPPELKANKQSFPITLIGYSNEQMMVLTKMVGDGDVDEMITEIFNNNPVVAYLHARNSQACCYICKIERL